MIKKYILTKAMVGILIITGTITCKADKNKYSLKQPKEFEKNNGELFVRVAQGKDEPYSIGSYTVRVYDASDEKHLFDNFMTGLIKKRNGAILDFWIADINNNRKLDIHIWIKSVGSGAYGELHSYELKGNKLINLTLPNLNKKSLKGYMGHDKFTILMNKLYRSFPLYNLEDSNAKPTGGEVTFVYSIKANKWKVVN